MDGAHNQPQVLQLLSRHASRWVPRSTLNIRDSHAASSHRIARTGSLLTAAAYVLLQELRLHAKHTGCARAQVSTLRERLLKVGVWIEVSVRRIVLHLPASYPFKHDWGRLAVALGAKVG